MELKHLMITAIVANAAKSGRSVPHGFEPALTNAILEDARPSDGVFASLPKCLESPPAPSREERKKTTSAVFHLSPVLFRMPLPRLVASMQRLANASEIPALDMNGASPESALAKNATRCGFSARQHPNYQGYVQGGDVQPGPYSTAGHRPTVMARRAEPVFADAPEASTALG